MTTEEIMNLKWKLRQKYFVLFICITFTYFVMGIAICYYITVDLTIEQKDVILKACSILSVFLSAIMTTALYFKELREKMVQVIMETIKEMS